MKIHLRRNYMLSIMKLMIFMYSAIFILLFVCYEIGLAIRLNATKIERAHFKKLYAMGFNETYGTYHLNDKPVIWVFWVSRLEEMPPFMKLSLCSMICHNEGDFNHVLVSDEKIEEWLDDVHPSYNFLIPAHKSDYVRARILHQYGGIYTDVDTIGLTSFAKIYDRLKDYDVINIDWKRDGDPMAVGVMGPMKAWSDFTTDWITKVDLTLDGYESKLKQTQLTNDEKLIKYPIRWSEILRDIIKPIIQNLEDKKQIKYLKLNGAETFGQFILSGKKMMDRVPYIDGNLTLNRTPALMYGSSLLHPSVRGASMEKVLHSDSVLSELIRTSFKYCFTGETPSVIKITPNTLTNNNTVLIDRMKQYCDRKLYQLSQF